MNGTGAGEGERELPPLHSLLQSPQIRLPSPASRFPPVIAAAALINVPGTGQGASPAAHSLSHGLVGGWVDRLGLPGWKKKGGERAYGSLPL